MFKPEKHEALGHISREHLLAAKAALSSPSARREG
jgi:hypothetical protein